MDRKECQVPANILFFLQEYIIERVKKIGGFTTFNNFIMRELETMYKLLTEIKSTLLVITGSALYYKCVVVLMLGQ